jgi:hypothetical protein
LTGAPFGFGIGAPRPILEAMNKLATSLALIAVGIPLATRGAELKDLHCFELRTYYAAPGKLDELNARFRDHTCKLFEKHGILNLGYWMPIENPESKLIYLLAYPTREAREAAWKAFMADPDWEAVFKASELNGRLVTKVESLFLAATDYSPEVRPTTNAASRVFELRTYTAAPGRLDALNARFRDHTVKLFEKHGITSIGYWTPMKDQKGADNTLIYLLSHPSREAAAEAFKAFGADPDWLAARKTSEEQAGGSLTVSNGVRSVFLQPTDYSTLR